MKQTNIHGLPEAIARAVEMDPYDKGGADFSVTELLKPPQIVQLTKKYESRLSVDVSDSIWGLLGSGVHHVLERAYEDSEAVLERRLFATYREHATHPFNLSDAEARAAEEEDDAYVISGAMDVYEARKITDYKVTATYTVMRAEHDEWEQQLNIYDWLCAENDIEVNELEIVVIMRDWKKSQRFKANYPQMPVKIIPINRWTHSTQEEFIRSRIELHTALRPRECSKEETWGGIRCKDWCPVADWCPQYNKTG